MRYHSQHQGAVALHKVREVPGGPNSISRRLRGGSAAPRRTLAPSGGARRGVYTFQADGTWGNMSIMAQNPLQTVLASIWIGPSALHRAIVSIPGALPQAGMDRAFSPVEMVNGQFPSQRVDQRPICPIVSSNLEVRTKSAEGANHNSLGQRPRKCRNERGTRAESPPYRLIRINSSARSGGREKNRDLSKSHSCFQ